jgi:hypothetical protein
MNHTLAQLVRGRGSSLICRGSCASGQMLYDTRLLRAYGATVNKQDADRCLRSLLGVDLHDDGPQVTKLDGYQSRRPGLRAAVASMLPYVSGNTLRFCRVEQHCKRAPVIR